MSSPTPNLRVVTPKSMSEEERARFTDALHAVQCEVFDGVDREQFRKYVVDSKAHKTEIQVMEDDEGQIVGYCAAHFFEMAFQGRECVVMRMEAGLKREYRGSNVVGTFVARQVVQHRLSNPTTPMYYMGSLVHPSSYAALANSCDTIYPAPDRPTPPEIEAFMLELGDAFGLEMVDPDRPLVRDVGWITRDQEVERDYWRRCRKTLPRFFVDANPGYHLGHGLITLVPFDTVTMGRSLARWGGGRLKQQVQRITGLGSAEADELDPMEVMSDSDELHGVPEPALRAMGQRGQRVEFKAGQFVFHQGDPGDAVYVVLRGSAMVYLGHDAPVLVDQMVEGEVFGGMAVLTSEPRSASVRAATSATLLKIPREALQEVIAEHPEAGRALWRNIARDRFDNHLRDLPRFKGSTRAQRRGWFDRGAPMDDLDPREEGLCFLYEGTLEITAGSHWGTLSAPALFPASFDFLRPASACRLWHLPER